MFGSLRFKYDQVSWNWKLGLSFSITGTTRPGISAGLMAVAVENLRCWMFVVVRDVGFASPGERGESIECDLINFAVWIVEGRLEVLIAACTNAASS